MPTGSLVDEKDYIFHEERVSVKQLKERERRKEREEGRERERGE